MHDDFECPSPRDYVDTKSWLAYEQNPYSTHWVRSGSCHREMSLGYDILPAITRLQANTNIWLLHDATTPRCSELEGCATLPRPVQPWVAAPSTAWLGSIVASMTWQHHHQHDSASTSHNNLIVNVNEKQLQRQADTLPAHTSTIHHYVWFQGQCKNPDTLFGTSVKHLHFEDRRLKTLS
jgi:hypothetical protein